MEANALVAYDISGATNATTTTTGQEQGMDGQDLSITRQLRLPMEINHLKTPSVLRTTSGNAEKKLKIR